MRSPAAVNPFHNIVCMFSMAYFQQIISRTIKAFDGWGVNI